MATRASVLDAVRGLARWVARRRHDRALHPSGATWAAVAHLAPGDHALAGVPDLTPATVRLSRGAGLPSALPDVHGIGIRLSTDPPVDLLLSTSRRLGIDIPWPRRRPEGTGYSTLVSFRDRRGVRLRVHGRLACDPNPVVRLEQVDAAGSRPVAELVATAPLPEASAPRLDPSAAPPGLEPTRWFARLRAAAYLGSREGSPAPPVAEPIADRP
jgi:hypothetical protein